MARRRKTSAFEDLILIASLLPWWLSVLLTLLSWYWLHGYSTSSPPRLTNPSRYSNQLPGEAFRDWAAIFQDITATNCIFRVASVSGHIPQLSAH